ncbi:MAG: hypothetical protein WBL20_00620 [Sphingobium sp.]|uniref:hypothetical protein n=1 Tax=Sphingobium sp. TaxID=1912891 RepID=UPI003BB185E9
MFTTQTLAHGPVNVMEHRQVQVEGETVSLPPRAYVLSPGDDLSAQPGDVRAVCEAWWTPERVAQYQAIVQAAEDAAEPMAD